MDNVSTIYTHSQYMAENSKYCKAMCMYVSIDRDMPMFVKKNTGIGILCLSISENIRVYELLCTTYIIFKTFKTASS